jgi:iron complex outermembrane receptor protein
MRIAVVATAVCLCLVGLAVAQDAGASVRRATDIPAQSLNIALQKLAKERGLALAYRSEIVGNLKSAGAVGELTTDEAFTRILSGTGLTYRYLDDKTVTIVPAASTESQVQGSGGTSSTDHEGTKSFSDGFRVAQATPGPTSSDVSVEQKNDEKKKKEEELQVVVVTGSRIPTAAGQQTLPVLSYTREDIQNSGQSTIGDFLNTLPDVSTSSNGSLQLGLSGAQAVQLHGLPLGTTLALLDGRRLDLTIGGYFDLSHIPLAAVERIEILPVGASAIYGADGLGGAVNTILRKDFDGFELNVALDHADDVNNPEADVAWGKSWERGSISVIGSYQDTGELLGAQREPWSLTSLPASVPAATVSAIASTACAPGNVYSVDGSNLPGLSSPEAAIPAGITGRPTIGQFEATAGTQNLCNASRYHDITPRSQREGALLSAHYELANSLEFFTETLLSHGHLQSQNGPQILAYGDTVAANNPYNPFGQAVNVNFVYPGRGQLEVQSTSLIRPLIGVQGSFLSDWHYEVTAYFLRDQLHDVNTFTDSQLIFNALAASTPATALNPFTNGAPGTPELLSSLSNPAVDRTDFSYDDQTVSGQGILRGPLLHLPAGALQAVIGGEYSRQIQDTLSFGTPFLLHRNTYALFSEARIPLLAGGAPEHESERLALSIAGRYDHSNDYGGKATWQSGLLWRAGETLSLRGGYGLSYQAPQLSEISGPTTFTPASSGFSLDVPDPFRGNQVELYPINLLSGPNFKLKPQTGDAFTLGLEYSSQALQGLHGSFTWYDLKITNYIGAESFQSLLAYPNLFPGAVVRAPPTSLDQQLGYLGEITQLNYLFYNFGDLRVAGFDADVSYAIDSRAGRFTPSVAIANVYKWQSALLPGTPAINGLNTATGLLGVGVGWSPRWKGTAGLAWKQGPYSMNLAGRYVGRYLDYQTYVSNANEIGNTWIFDFNTRYEAGRTLVSKNSWLAGSYIALGVVNLFNKTPPFSYTPYMYDLQEYDIRGRFLHLSVGTRF